MKQKEKKIPYAIKFISSSLFLFMIGRWLWTDTYFSIYVKNIIGNAWWVTCIGALLAITKLFFSIPIGNINENGETKDILLLGKIFYALCGFLFFLAGLRESVILLILAVIFNGMASSTTFTTYRNYYDQNTTNVNRSQIFWFYFSSINIAEIVGALISAILVYYLDLPFMYFFVIIFSILSLIQEQKIKDTIKKKFQFRKKKRRNKKNNLIKPVSQHEYFFWEKGFVKYFFKDCFSVKPRKKMLDIFKKYDKKLFISLWGITLTNLLNYIGFLFIPIVSIENNLNLSQIALVFAVMKAPYLMNIIVGNLGDKYDKKLLIAMILITISTCYTLLWSLNGFSMTIILTFIISLGIALLNPICSALVSSNTKPKDKGKMAWLQEAASKSWEIIWALGFWCLSALVGNKTGFIIIGIIIFCLWCFLFAQKVQQIRTTNQEKTSTI